MPTIVRKPSKGDESVFNTDNSHRTESKQPQQQSGADQHQMQASEPDRAPHARSRGDEMRDWQRGFAGSM